MKSEPTRADTERLAARLVLGSLFGALIATLTMVWVILPHLAFAPIAIPLIAMCLWGASLYRTGATPP